MQPTCPAGAVGLQKRADPVASSRTGSARVQKGGADLRNCKPGATGGRARSRAPTARRRARAARCCSFSVWRVEIMTHSGAMHGLVAVAPLPPLPRHDLLTYRVPEPLRDRVRPGVRVRVPLGRQTRIGVVAAFAEAEPPGELRSIVDVLDAEPFLPTELLELCGWAARYYLAPLAEVIATIVPASLRALVAAGLIEVLRARDPTPPTDGLPPPTLTPAQRAAAEAIAAAVGGEPASFLLHGITGSGKTEVFLAAAEAALRAGRDVILLVPEIALTHQLVERVRARFPSTLAVLHSGLGPRQRWSEWRRILAGEARVVGGARSAVFAPARRLGLVVVDEEHDAAYKQEEGLRYNARDLAVVRARLAGAVAVLASATPSAESYQAALDGRHRLLSLPERPTAHPLPVVEVVDLRARADDRKRSRLVSEELRRALEANLAAGGQTLVFLNRRGFAVYLLCAGCGAALDCPLCSVTLAWHRAARALVCHHCRHTRRPPAACPAG